MKLVQWKQTNHLNKFSLYHRRRRLKDGTITDLTVCGRRLPAIFAEDDVREPRKKLDVCCRRCLGIA